MRIINFFKCAILIFAFTACSKKNEIAPNELPSEQKLYNIGFTVKGFIETYNPINKLASTSADAPSKPVVNDLVYIVLDKDKKPIDTLMSKTNGNGNSLSLKLPNGKYSIRILGLNLDITEFGAVYDKNLRVFFSYRPQNFCGFNNQYNYSDVFVFNKEIEVTKDSIYSSFVLQRFNSKLELNILDAIPSSVATLEVDGLGTGSVYGAYGEGSLKDVLTYDYSSHISKYFDLTKSAGLSNQTFSMNFLTKEQNWSNITEKVVTIKIAAYDVNRRLLLTKEVANVKLAPNTITTLSGKVFDDINRDKQSSLSVVLNESYSKNVIKQSF